MRILAIRGKNLASLRGEFAIELNKPPLEQAGLFAITGHTGAGKSTLLDAMCLALFDRIPRLLNTAIVKVGRHDEDEKDRISSNDVASIMSRGMAIAFAEVDFVGIDKQVYQAHWEVKRARNKITGRLQKQSITLKNLNTDEIIGEKKSETLDEISQKIGLNFEQFRRSVLLAQGDFAAFLKAKSDERSGLLERITGTEIYSQLSMAAFRRFQEEDQALHRIKDQLLLDMPLENQPRQELDLAIAELEKKRNDLQIQIQTHKASLDWHLTREKLEQEKNKAVTELESLKQENEDKRTQKEELEQVISVQPLASLQRTLSALLEQESKLNNQLQQSQTINNTQENEEKILNVSVEQIKKQLNVSETDFNQIKPELLQARELDTKINLSEKELNVQTALMDTLNQDIHRLEEKTVNEKTLKQQSASIQKELDQIIEQIDKLKIQKQAIDHETLNKKKEEAETTLNEWLKVQVLFDHFIRQREGLKNTQHETEKSQAKISQLSQNIILKEKEQLKLSVAMDEAKRALTMLQESVTKDVKSIRGLLHENEPCPVCGSPKHPWAGQDDTLDNQYHQQKLRVEELELSLQKHIIDINAFRQKLDYENKNNEQFQKLAKQYKQEISETELQWDAIKHDKNSLQSLSDDSSQQIISSEIDAINKNLELFKQQNKQVVELQKALDELHIEKESWLLKEKQQEQLLADQKVLHTRIDSLKQQLRIQLQESNKRQQQKEQLSQERQNILNGEAANTIESQMQATISQLSKDYESQKRKLESIRQNQIRTAQEIVHLKQQIDASKTQQQTCDKQLSDALEQQSISRDTFKLLLDKDEAWIESTKKYFSLLNNKIIQAETVLKERVNKLNEHDIKRLEAVEIELEKKPDNKIENIQLLLKEKNLLLQTISDDYQEKIIERKQDDIRKQRLAEYREQLDAQQERWQQWGELNDLIGSANGQKFRVFAHSLTLESLLAFANIHLNDFARRYQLQRVPGTDLDLQIIDRDMADEVRSVQSLSGGESFLVSLALALGLASLSSSKTQVESLFIDEGFGTLDQETLDIAIASLDTLQGLGRKVGIISHVPILVERIGTKIVVEKTGGGQSRILIQE